MTCDQDQDPRIITVIGMASFVTCDCDLDVFDHDPACQGRTATQITELVWDPEAPHAVALLDYEDLGDASDFEPVRVFALELLEQGLIGQATGGTIAVAPVGAGWIAITLNPHRADLSTIYAPRALVEDFAREARTRIPAVAGIDADWDAALVAILGAAS